MSRNALTIAEFRVQMPRFEDDSVYEDAYVADKLDEAWRQINVSRLGNRSSDAQKYLAAHLITLFPPSGVTVSAAGREVVSVTAGRSSVSYANSQGASSDKGSLEATTYGKEYLRICKQRGGATLVNGGGFLI
jgi:hypothetical protein